MVTPLCFSNFRSPALPGASQLALSPSQLALGPSQLALGPLQAGSGALPAGSEALPAGSKAYPAGPSKTYCEGGEVLAILGDGQLIL